MRLLGKRLPGSDLGDRARRVALSRTAIDAMALRAATLCILGLPVALLHARAVAEMLIGATDALFLVHMWVSRQRDWVWAARDGAWLSRGFVRAAAAWWLWLVLCSALGTGGLVLALVAFRLPLLAVAAGEWVLVAARTRRWLWRVLAAAVGWIVLESWQQYLTGSNLFGHPPFGDGALTGPFNRPRAGPVLILTLFPVLVPAVAAWVGSDRRWRQIVGALGCMLCVATVPLIAQRMPTALLVLGLLLTGVLLPRLRAWAAAACLAGILLVAATPVLAPAGYHKLVVRTHEQVAHFATSAYGEIWVRALVIARQHPWLGLGFDGFRRGCSDPGAVQGLAVLGVTLADARQAQDACNIHPHNYYLEALDNGGLPLLVLFSIMMAAALWRLAGGWRSGLDPLRAGLLVGFILAAWPVASTSAFTSLPNAGWIFLLVGYGFAEASRHPRHVQGFRAVSLHADHREPPPS
jgi:hypothetical protein